MTPATRAFLERDGRRLVYYRRGDLDAPPVVFLHGGRSSAATFSRVSLALGTEYQTIALDQRGHGASDRFDDYSWQRWVDDVAFLFRELELPPAILVGHSVGGWISYLFAASVPDAVRSLVVVDAGPVPFSGARPPTLSFADRAALLTHVTAQVFNAAPDVLDRLIADDFHRRPDGSYTWRVDPEVLAPRTIERIIPPASAQWEALANLRCPVQLVVAEHGLQLRPEIIAEMQRVLVDCELVTVRGSGHFIQIEAHDAFVATLRSFCERTVLGRAV